MVHKYNLAFVKALTTLVLDVKAFQFYKLLWNEQQSRCPQIEIPYFREQLSRQLFFFEAHGATIIQGRQLFKGGNYCFLGFFKPIQTCANIKSMVNFKVKSTCNHTLIPFHCKGYLFTYLVDCKMSQLTYFVSLKMCNQQVPICK